MSNQVEVRATITLKPEAVAIVELLNTRTYGPPGVVTFDEISKWQQVAERFPLVAEYAKNEGCDSVPFGCYGPLDGTSELDGLQWEIECSTNNYDDEIEAFLVLLPTIADAVTLEVDYEGLPHILVRHALKDGHMVETERHNLSMQSHWDRG